MKKMKFKNYKYKEPVPFTVYADIECMLKPIADKSNSLNTTLYQRHVPHTVAYYLQCNFDDSISKFRPYRGKDCVEWFMNQLKELAQVVEFYLKRIVPMESLNFKQRNEFYSAKICHVCEKPFTPQDAKHRDHCHFTGKYRGAAHQGV
ncbi:uncharacterized protein LOC112494699 isoform X2 [Cephus cinctus]|uniref:Uncharacterized protein LOC112494699 isoform X2 n=1 Tax=Cephus cinctus TaxID=211228 RepID=A0AAJ7RLX5_CEPCN|nr:uncharacterized protein LOC112494699 isoform X2 [Cephus cinctus]